MIYAVICDKDGNEVCPRAPVTVDLGPMYKRGGVSVRLLETNGKVLAEYFGFQVAAGDSLTLTLKELRVSE